MSKTEDSETLAKSIVEGEDIAEMASWSAYTKCGSQISVDNSDSPVAVVGIDIGRSELRKSHLFGRRYSPPEESVAKTLHN